MNALRVGHGDGIEAALPGSLRQHPALRRLRASLQAQCPSGDAVNTISARLLSTDGRTADHAEIQPVRAEIADS